MDLPENIRTPIIELLNASLAISTDLKSQVKQAHWNVKGMNFYQLHLLFDTIAGELEEYIDLVAERITALGGVANGTVRIAATNSILPEYPLDIVNSIDHVNALAERLAVYAQHLRDNMTRAMELGDQDTNDLYIEVSRTIDKYLWFLEAHLQGNQ
ncbi:MAG: DNA starvation/stationary phase protection protein Dps [Cyanobacteria bacterium P01_E01_bin.35]